MFKKKARKDERKTRLQTLAQTCTNICIFHLLTFHIYIYNNEGYIYDEKVMPVLIYVSNP